MVMMLPFLIALIAGVFVMLDKRTLAVKLWALSLLVMLMWLKYHITSSLNLSF